MKKIHDSKPVELLTRKQLKRLMESNPARRTAARMELARRLRA